MKVLGKNWGIHVFDDAREERGSRIVRRGPYGLLRHPIYAGVILELIAIPLAFNAPVALAFVTLVNIPLQILRSRLEEQNLLMSLGGDYAFYMRQVPALLPKIKRPMSDTKEGRRFFFGVEFPERRKR
jgi:protein-S-isoprenylcysteine O-methyltransferase Ste14